MLGFNAHMSELFIEIQKICLAYAADIAPVGRINIQCITVTKGLHNLKY